LYRKPFDIQAASLDVQQKLRDGVTLTLSTLIDGKNFQQGGHKVGLALELEA
jgi:voltage-dependent anion channel protein 2